MSRIILKFSGEALKNNDELVAKEKLAIILKTIKLLQENNHKIAIVIGGGNFFRGRSHAEMEKVTGDTIGMLGTVMNALYVKDYLEKNNIKSIISTPFNFPNLIDNYSNEELKEIYNKGNIIIFGGGVGLSGYSTDSGTILARNILDANLIIKMTNVDGVYNDDPKINKNATKFAYLSYQDVLDNEYQVMDLYAIKECQKTKTKILVMNIDKYDKINDYFNGKNIGTEIGDEDGKTTFNRRN